MANIYTDADIQEAIDALEKLKEVKRIVEMYEAWHIDSPEDSWRFERDIREALDMPQAEYPEW